MDEKTSIELRKALDLLKAGDAKNARPILVRILKEDQEIEQAWYMLSFVISEYPKQKYALEQVLRINPANQKAKARLAKLSGDLDQSVPGFGSPPAPTSLPRQEPVERPSGGSRGGDLVNERLGTFGVQPVEQSSESSLGSITPQAESGSKKRRAKPKKEKKKKKKRKAAPTYSSDPFSYLEDAPKKSRTKLLLFILLIVILMSGIAFVILGGGDIIGNLMGGPGIEATVPPVEEITQPTPTPEGGGRRLPPTWTPTPTDTPAPTPTPTLIPTATEPPTS